MTRSGARSGGFTLVEVLVAVAVLGLCATGALRLALLAQRALDEARTQRAFLQQVTAVQMGLRAKSLPESGTSGDLRWERAEGKREEGEITPLTWPELEITAPGRSLRVVVP